MGKTIKQILQVAATYIGTVVGAGFATGKEVVEFFTQYQGNGILGIFISSILFVWLGTRMMVLSARIEAYSFQDLIVHLSGKTVGKIFNYFMLAILLGVTSVMLSGTGAIFQEQLGLPYRMGVLITVIFCFFVMKRGLSGVLMINSIVVPLMVCFCLLIAGKTLQDFDVISATIEQALHIVQWDWLFRSITYASLNLCLAQAVLVPLGREIRDENILKWGGILGGIGLCFMLVCTNLSLLSLKEVINYDIPMAEVIKPFGSYIHLFFLLVIYGEIFTTLVGNVFGITRQIQALSFLSEKWVGAFVLFICLFISQIGFGTLLGYLYPLFGYIGFVFLLLLIWKRNAKPGINEK